MNKSNHKATLGGLMALTLIAAAAFAALAITNLEIDWDSDEPIW